jgi:dsDNA-specific endonuclease/ATPase MutS2
MNRLQGKRYSWSLPEVLDANNEIRDLEHAQKREVIRILKQLTDEVEGSTS